jgi:hypothetical protein
MVVDFENSKLLKLAPVEVERFDWAEDTLIVGERGLLAFLGVRDSVLFTNHRVVMRNVKGVTGTEVSTTTIPYSRITAFTVVTSGLTGVSVDLTLYVSNIPPILMEFTRDAEVTKINALLSRAVLAK